MTWEQRDRLRQTARNSLVLWASLALFAALLFAPAVRWLDRETGWVMFGFSAEGARSVLGILVGSMLTFLVFVLSTTLIVVQLASGQSTPRVISLVLATPRVKLALGTITFTYVYTLAALGRVDERVPELLVGVAVLLNLMCIVVFFMFVHRLSSGMRPAALVQLVAEKAEGVINDVYPLPYDSRAIEQTAKNVMPTTPTQIVEHSGRSGVVEAYSAMRLVTLACEANAIVELVPQVGDFISAGDPLFRIASGSPKISPARLRGCVAIGVERTLEQDPRFIFRILVDMASKALSPGINDPTTAVHVLDQIQHLLLYLGRRCLDEGKVCDRDGAIRLMYGTPDWPDYVTLAVSEIRHFGSGSLQVHRRLRAMLVRLIEVLPESRRPPLQRELTLLGHSVDRQFDDEEDRNSAKTADLQGVGGSEL